MVWLLWQRGCGGWTRLWHDEVFGRILESQAVLQIEHNHGRCIDKLWPISHLDDLLFKLVDASQLAWNSRDRGE
jgi:hypothetical protein